VTFGPGFADPESMRHLLALPLALMLCAASALAQSAPPAAPDFDRLLARGIELHQAGDILGARTHALHGRFDFIFWHVESL